MQTQGKSVGAMLAALYCSAFLAGFNENMMNMTLISVMSEFEVDSVTAQWLVTAFMIGATLVVMSTAFFFRRVKLRPLFLTACALTIVGSAIGLVSTSFPMLMAARVVQALGSGFFIPVMVNAILVVAPMNKLGTYISIGGCMITFGPALAPVVCGALVTGFGWRSVFIVPLAAMVLLAIVGFVFVRNLGSSHAHLDLPSVVLSAVMLTGISYGLAQVMSDPLVGGVALGIAVVTCVAFVMRQNRCAHPLIDLTPMKSSAFWPAAPLVVVAMMSTFSQSVLLPLYFEGAVGMSAMMAGLVILVPVLANAVTTLIGGRIMDKAGSWPLLPAGFAVIAIGFVLMALFAPSLSVPAMFFAALVSYSGVGFVFSPSQTAGLRTLSQEQNPFGVALLTTFTQFAACIGPALYIGIMQSSQESALAQGVQADLATAQGFVTAVIVAAVIGFAGSVIAFVYSRRARATTSCHSRRSKEDSSAPLRHSKRSNEDSSAPFRHSERSEA